MPTDAINRLRALRDALNSSSEKERASEQHFTDWKIGRQYVTAPDGTRFQFSRHGMDRYVATRVAQNAIVLHGDYPRVTEVTGDVATIASLIDQVSESGALFTVYGSLYRNGSETVLLLDYLR